MVTYIESRLKDLLHSHLICPVVFFMFASSAHCNSQPEYCCLYVLISLQRRSPLYVLYYLNEKFVHCVGLTATMCRPGFFFECVFYSHYFGIHFPRFSIIILIGAIIQITAGNSKENRES